MKSDTADLLREPKTSASSWDDETDILVFGSGIGGLSAALFAAKAGQSVVLCEKTGQIGGTTATSGGIAWIPGNAHAREDGIDDPIDRARTYLKHELGNYYRADLVDAFLESGGDALAELEKDTDVGFHVNKRADYHADQVGGALSGRSLEADNFDGRELGVDFELVRPPRKRLMLFGGMPVNKRKLDDFLNPFRSIATFRRAVATLARYAADRLRYSRGTDINAGNALVARLLSSLRKRNVIIWVDSPLISLVVDGGAVLGAQVQHNGETKRVRARRAVILATGGFPHNAAMRAEFSAAYPHAHSVAFEGNVGEGISMARAIGAVVDTELVSPALWQPSSLLTHSDGSVETILYGYLDRGRPGVIAVDRNGERFVNESNSYHDVVMAMYRRDAGAGGAFHFVCDRRFVWKRGLGVIRPFTPSLRRYVKSGYLVMADTLNELAQKAGIDPQGLERTVRRHNEFAKTGVDLDFGKGSNPYNRQFGDPSAGPNPNLGPIEHAPFIALRIHPGTLGTAAGLKTTADAQVVSSSGAPISGLYACGNDMASVMRGFYPGGGITLGPAIVFAFRAIRHATAAR